MYIRQLKLIFYCVYIPSQATVLMVDTSGSKYDNQITLYFFSIYGSSIGVEDIKKTAGNDTVIVDHHDEQTVDISWNTMHKLWLYLSRHLKYEISR